ncbi:hypothetical protein CPB84DRAFT_330795 [Gymnopilus junonius]|uniref:NACHT domain-containing protein n=1 Tax=Gymnopilus junonius TaxID=109634 RepID=A0A9P5NDI6_GYMJU|nr:hypothetical protein CPB84DRAFT_330795 [Gymnopilus junonius]
MGIITTMKFMAISTTMKARKALSKVIATGALHDSYERFPPPKCHPRTRRKIIDLIISWIEDEASSTDILWLYGPAGAGKSAIMQSIAEFYRLAEDRLAASFFFSKGKPGRDDERLLFATIAYQLALHIPGLREYVNRAMLLDPALHTKDVHAQLQALIVEPLQRLTVPLPPIYLVIIDGLDECQSLESHRRVLNLIAGFLANSGVRFRFLITSRFEVHIRNTFNLPHLDHRTRRLSLDSSLNPDRDIRIYLQEEFDKIAELNSDLIPPTAKPWPPTEVLDRLVEKSSGHFIYPATVIKFVGADRYDPKKQLDIVLSPAGTPPSSPTLNTNVDSLYTQILHTCPYPDNLARILSLLLILHCPQPPEVYADLLGIQKSDVTVTLRGLHSLVKMPDDEEDYYERHKFSNRFEYDQTRGLRLHHATFIDYLLDSNRCPKHFVVDLDAAHFELVKAGSQLMKHWIYVPWSYENKLPPLCHETWGYLKHHLGIHLSRCQSTTRATIVEELSPLRVIFPPKRPHNDKIWNDSFQGLHSMLTALAEAALSDSGHLEPQLLNPANFQSEHSHWTKETPNLSSASGNNALNEDIKHLFTEYRTLLDKLYQSALSSSKEVLELLNQLPGLIDRETPVLFDWLENICGHGANELSLAVERNQKFIYQWDTSYWTQVLAAGQGHVSTDVVWINPHFSAFLRDPDRAGTWYWDPKVRHLLDLCQIIKMIFRPAWVKGTKEPGALEYLDRILKACLDSIGVDSLGAAVQYHNDKMKLLDVMTSITYDVPCLNEAPVRNVDLIWSATRRILDWVYRQISSKMDRNVKHALVKISNHIYRQILEIGTSSQASLTSFLTKKERAGPLYLPASVYHTQMAEICLDRCNPHVSDLTKDWKIVASHTEWRFHLTRASPSPKILEQLRTMPLGPWLAEGLPSSERAAKARSIDAILEWLKKVGQKQPEIQTSVIRQRWEEDLARFQQFKRRRIVSFRSDSDVTVTYSEISSATSSHFLDLAYD